MTVATWTAGALLMTVSYYLAGAEWKPGRWKYLLAFVGSLTIMKYSGWFQLNRQHAELLLKHARIVALVLIAASSIFTALSLRAYLRSHPPAALKKFVVGFTGMTIASLLLIWQLKLSAQQLWALSGFAVALGLSAMVPILRMPVVVGMNRHR